MAVKITDICISCDACLDECPVGAIVDNDDNPTGEDVYYVYKDKCVSVLDTMMLQRVQMHVLLRVV